MALLHRPLTGDERGGTSTTCYGGRVGEGLEISPELGPRLTTTGSADRGSGILERDLDLRALTAGLYGAYRVTNRIGWAVRDRCSGSRASWCWTPRWRSAAGA